MLNFKSIILNIIIQGVSIFIIVIFALFLVNSIFSTELDYPNLQQTIEQSTKIKFEKEKDNIKILILGDSHPGQAFNVELPKEYFRATHAGEDISLTLLKLEYFLSKSDKIESIVLPLDYHSLNGSFGVNRKEYLLYSNNPVDQVYSKVYSYNHLVDDYNRKVVIRWLLAKFNNKYLLKTKAEQPGTGFEVINIKSAKFQDAIKNRVRELLHPPIISKVSVNSINEIITIARERKVNVIGIRYPLPNLFLKEVYSTNSNLMDKWIKNNRDLFDEVYDYRYLFKNKQYFFGNEDHLNIPGAREFTRIYLNEKNKIAN